MISISSDQLILWLTSFIWPLTRILGLIAVAPIFGSATIPVRIKISLGAMLALLVAPTLQNTPLIDPVSIPGILILVEQFVIGIAMGFTIQLVFTCVDLAGNLISMAMGLGFASYFDVETRGNTPVVGQFLTLVTTLLFLSLNLHLDVLATLADSFTHLPIATDLSKQTSIWLRIANTGSLIFSSGVQLALPVITALLIANVALGILTRTAPQLNLFGIGFPITLAVGFLMLYIVMPYLAAPLQKILELGVQQSALR